MNRFRATALERIGLLKENIRANTTDVTKRLEDYGTSFKNCENYFELVTLASRLRHEMRLSTYGLENRFKGFINDVDYRPSEAGGEGSMNLRFRLFKIRGD